MNFTFKVNMDVFVYDKQQIPDGYQSGNRFSLSLKVREDNIFNAKKMAEDIAVKELAPEIAANRHGFKSVMVVTMGFEVLENYP